jgi:nucleotide-binding universal stress UspA family protein
LLQSFNNILLPVDLSWKTETAVTKAIELAGSRESVFHLVHVADPNTRMGSFFKEDKKTKLNMYKETIERAVPGSLVNTYLIRGKPIEKIIIQTAKAAQPQLIILGRHANHNWFSFKKSISSSNIAKETHSAVLTIQPGSFLHKIRSIVLPIRSFIPTRKVDMLFPFVNNKGTTIYLVSVINEEAGDLDYSSASHALIETYRLLKEEANCQIVHKLIRGKNLARTLLQFSESVNADILLLNPDESRFWSVTGPRDFSDLLTRHSCLQVMAVDPNSAEL